MNILRSPGGQLIGVEEDNVLHGGDGGVLSEFLHQLLHFEDQFLYSLLQLIEMAIDLYEIDCLVYFVLN